MIAGLRPVFIAEITHSPRINLGVLTRTESFIYISDLSRPAEDLNQYGDIVDVTMSALGWDNFEGAISMFSDLTQRN